MEIVTNDDNLNQKDNLVLNIIILREDNKAIDLILSKYNKINNNYKKLTDAANYEIHQQKVKKKMVSGWRRGEHEELAMLAKNITIQFIKIINFKCFDEISKLFQSKINFLIIISKNNNKNTKNFTDDQCRFIKKLYKISKEIFLIQNKLVSGTVIDHISRNCFIENFIISNI